MVRSVAVLCASLSSAYHEMSGVDVYDEKRDALSFAGDCPIVAHPPCAGWSRTLRCQAKQTERDVEVAVFCCDMLRRCGGVLEQPAGSHLFQIAGLPGPAETIGDLHTMRVWQAWWGYPTRKDTWLCFSKIDIERLHVPYRLINRGSCARRFQRLSRKQRSATYRAFAEWLVNAARLAREPLGQTMES